MIAKELQRMLSEPDDRIEILPWWVGPSVLEQVNEAHEEIRGNLSILSDKGRPYRRSLARIGFAAAAASV